MRAVGLETVFAYFFCAPWVWGPLWGEEVLLRAFKATLSNGGHGPGVLGHSGLEHFNCMPPSQLCLGVGGQELAWGRGKERWENRRGEEGREQERVRLEIRVYSH